MHLANYYILVCIERVDNKIARILLELRCLLIKYHKTYFIQHVQAR